MLCVLRVVGSLLAWVAGGAREPGSRTPMAEVDRGFELRQLLRAYRRGLISDEVLEEQLHEIGAVGNGAAAPIGHAAEPAKVYRVRERTFAAERDMILHFLDEFRAGETFGGEVFALWYSVCRDPRIRGGLQVVREREAMHGKLLAARIATLGGRSQAALPEKFQAAARARLGSAEISDADKIADFVRRLPDAEAAVAPIRAVIAQIEQDCESRALLENVLEDELSTVRWFHAVSHPAASGS